MRLVRLGRNGPGVSEMGLGCMGMWAAMGTLATRTPSRPSMPRSRPASPCRIPATFTARDKRLTATGGRWFGNYETPAVISKVGRPRGSRSTSLSMAARNSLESQPLRGLVITRLWQNLLDLAQVVQPFCAGIGAAMRTSCGALYVFMANYRSLPSL